MSTAYFALMNLALDAEVQLGMRTVLRPMSEAYLRRVYLSHGSCEVPDWDLAPWRPEHNVEAIILLDDGVDAYSSVAKPDEIVAPLIYAIRMSRIRRSKVYATHMRAEQGGQVNGLHVLRGYGDVDYSPRKLTIGEVSLLRRAFAIVEGVNREDDRVLQTALDRLMVGLGQSLHHPLRINRPNWDRVVDYVIALETLLLSAHKQQRTHESLSYRLALNAAALLPRANPQLQPGAVFRATKHIYAARSKIVHGEPETDIIGIVNKYLAALQVDDERQRHALGRLQLACQTLETWIYWLMEYLVQMPLLERPYVKEWGWEELLLGPKVSSRQ